MQDLIYIWFDIIKIIYIRIQLLCLTVWHYNITLEEWNDIKLVQKVACEIILENKYNSYEQAMKPLALQQLNDRRSMLSEKFAKRCVKGSSQVSKLFPRDLLTPRTNIKLYLSEITNIFLRQNIFSENKAYKAL